MIGVGDRALSDLHKWVTELEALTSIHGFEIDRKRYVLTPIMRDGSRGPPVELRELFEQFLMETADPHARPLQ
jgi:hypothetical protein